MTKVPHQATGAGSLPALLAWQIVEQLRADDSKAGKHLVEQDFADAFKVSRTPVREAFRILESMSVLERKAQRGYFIIRQADARESHDLQAAGEEEDWLYTRIAEDRLTDQIPRRFTENQLLQKYDVSRAYLLKLLLRMQQEGWLARLPGRSWEFVPLLNSPVAYDQSYRFRLLIEPAALLDPGYKISAKTVHILREQQQAMLEGGFISSSRGQVFNSCLNFHETIVAGSPNPFFLTTLRRANRLRSLMEYSIPVDRMLHFKEHLAVLDQLEAGDLQQASRLLYRHIESARRQKAPLAMRMNSTLSLS